MTERALLWIGVSSEQQAGAYGKLESGSLDKISLDQQERDLRALAERHGWLIADVLVIPGFSRMFYNFPEFAAAALEAGFDAGMRLLEHWRRRDFEVFACRDGSRFGREQPIFSEVVVRTIDGGARIYDLTTGWITRDNYRMYAAMGGYSASIELDKLRKYRDDGMTARARRGLPTSSKTPISHKVIRDELGRAVKMAPDESQRRLFDDLAALLLEGIGYGQLEMQLYKRFGHARPDGSPYHAKYFYHLLHTPTFWGHSARYHNAGDYAQSGPAFPWAFDLSIPPPDDVLFFPNTHVSFYTGEQAERVKDELRRRSQVVKGQSRPNRTHRFSGLLVCWACGYAMGRQRNQAGFVGWRCASRQPCYAGRRTCPASNYMAETKLMAWLTPRLQAVIDGQDVDALFGQMEDRPSDAQARLSFLEMEIEEAEGRARLLILKQMAAPDSLQALYDEQIELVGRQLNALRESLAAARRELVSADAQEQRRAVEGLRAYVTAEALWDENSRVVNQLLHRLFGAYRLVIWGGQVKGVSRKR